MEIPRDEKLDNFFFLILGTLMVNKNTKKMSLTKGAPVAHGLSVVVKRTREYSTKYDVKMFAFLYIFI